jgi:GNAT superfamily N-acetyltransferase
MDISICNAEKSDFDAIYPLFVQLWPAKAIDRAALQKVFDRGVVSDADELFCAVLEGNPIGFCAYAVVNNLWQEGQIAYVYAMVVDEKLRGQGIGTKLIQAVFERAKARGLKRVELDSSFQRERAHVFYEKLGFEKRAFLFSYTLK